MVLLDLQGLALAEASAPSDDRRHGPSNLSLLAICANSTISVLVCL
ncbi:MAG TPA: SapB/AmfS family lanthipeptide [Actinomycetota bacterium]